MAEPVERPGVDPSLRPLAVAWIDDDPDPLTRQELATVLDRADAGDGDAAADLVDRFAAPLGFGTAGLRGAIGAGPNRMNVAVVTRAAAALAAWVHDGSTDADGRPAAGAPEAGEVEAGRGVVIGYDARHRSRDFAEVTARVLAAAGIDAHLLPEPLPTPVLAFAVRHLGTAAGVMVTASHNPPADNGYKVYEASGRQIVAPTDRGIAAAMASIERVADVPVAPADHPRIHRLGDAVAAAYVAAVSTRVDPPVVPIGLAYTALHGVGAATVRRVLAATGFGPAAEVVEQVEPDPDFPTVAFPNPEEPGALDLGLARAAAAGVDVLLANDPDADRLGVAVPDPARGDASSVAGWRALRGDEIGVILADHLLRRGRVAADGVLATTIVSSSLLGRMAAAAGVPYVETLTGFKWVSRAAGPGQRLAFGYEEALGYCVGHLVGDKDGVSAAVTFAEAVADQAARGRSVLDVLDDLHRRHGVHATRQWSARAEGVDGLDRRRATMARLRTAPPPELARRAVERVVDLRDGDPDRGLPPSDVLVLTLDGGRVVVRPSGTEPKLKCYVEVVESVGADGDLGAARHRADTALAAVTDAIATAVRF